MVSLTNVDVQQYLILALVLYDTMDCSYINLRTKMTLRKKAFENKRAKMALDDSP